MGLGLRASQPIRAGDTIIRVPLPALLTLADGGHALGDGPKDDAAFAVLVAEYLRTGDDPFGPWLRADFASGGGLATLPGTWTEAELELLGTINPWQGNYAQRQRRQRIARYANLSATRPRATEHLPLPEFLRICSWVRARLLELPTADLDPEYAGQTALLPVVGLMNHAPDGEFPEADPGSARHVLLRASRDYAQGEELALRYWADDVPLHWPFLIYGFLWDPGANRSCFRLPMYMYHAAARDGTPSHADIGADSTQLVANCRRLHAGRGDQPAAGPDPTAPMPPLHFQNEALAVREAQAQLQLVEQAIDAQRSLVQGLPPTTEPNRMLAGLYRLQRRLVRFALSEMEGYWESLLWAGDADLPFPTTRGLHVPAG